MEIKHKVFKRKIGKSQGKWIVRIKYFDESFGRYRFMERHAEKKSDATDERHKLIGNIKKSYRQIQTGERMTFEQLARFCWHFI